MASSGFGALKLAFFAELWPHMPAARPWLLLLLPLQFIGWAWRWLRAARAFWGVAGLGVFAWFLLLVGGVGARRLGGRSQATPPPQGLGPWLVSAT